MANQYPKVNLFIENTYNYDEDILSKFLTLSVANQQINMQNYLDNNNVVDGSTKEFTSEYQDATKIDATKGFYNYKEVVYSRLVNYRLDANDNKFKDATVVATFDVIGHQAAEKAKAEAIENAKVKEKEKLEDKTNVVMQGYCRFKNDIEVTSISEYSYLDCEFSDIGKATMAVLIVPDFYAKALVAQPLYVSYSDEYGKEHRLNSTGGAVLNATKTSINIANIVNDFMLEKILSTTAYQGATAATEQAKAFLEAKSQARTKEQVNYVNMGDNAKEAVMTKNTEMPEKSDYITGAVVELVSSFVKTIGKSVLSDIRYSFKINKNAMVFADVVVSSDKGIQNMGGTIKKTKLVNKSSQNVLDDKGEYNFIPEDAGLEVEIKELEDEIKELEITKPNLNKGKELIK